MTRPPRASPAPDPAGPDRELLIAAREATRFAYAPYSKFRVGAAVRAADGRIFTGCNVENASYGLTICAERVALFTALAAGAKRLESLAVVARGPTPPYPCGACRQVMAEFLPPTARIWVSPYPTLRHAQCLRMRDLLPHPFEL